MRHDLTSGAWVEVRPIQDMKRKDKLAVARMRTDGYVFDRDLNLDQAATVAVLGGVAGANQRAGLNETIAVAACVVTDWSFDLPVPRIEGAIFTDRDSLDELPLEDSNELEQILAPYAEKLTFTPDPKAPVAATSSSSNGRSSAKAHSLKA